jgi:hypothetical protein
MAIGNYTKLLIHANGNNGENIFTDEIGKAVSIAGNPTTSTVQKKFGTSSFYSGYNTYYGQSDGLILTKSDDFVWSDVDGTLDLWFYRLPFPIQEGSEFELPAILFSFYNRLLTSSQPYFSVYLSAAINPYTSPDTELEVHNGLQHFACDITVSLNTWHHCALVKYGDVLKIYIDGHQYFEDLEYFSEAFQDKTLYLGKGANYGGFSGYIDEIRLLKGKAAWTTNNFTLPTSEYALSDPYTYALITATAGSNGSVSPTTWDAVLGTSKTFTFTPTSGYAVHDVLIDGVSVGAVDDYTFTDIQTDHTVAVTFSNTCAITSSVGDNGTVNPSGTSFVIRGSSQSFVFTPNVGYMVDDVLVDGVSVGSVTSYTFNDVLENHTISCTFVISETYHILSSSGSHGTIVPLGNVEVLKGTSKVFTVIPDTGYRILDIIIDGVSIGSIPDGNLVV